MVVCKLCFVISAVSHLSSCDVISRARDQRLAVEAVKKLGGTVTYDYMLDEKGELIREAVPPGPLWLHRIVGVDLFSRVVRVSLDCTEASDNDLRNLRAFRDLRWLNLVSTKITDAGMVHLETLKRLERIDLGGGTRVTDQGLLRLRGLSRLHSLYVDGPGITEAGIRALQVAIPGLGPPP